MLAAFRREYGRRFLIFFIVMGASVAARLGFKFYKVDDVFPHISTVVLVAGLLVLLALMAAWASTPMLQRRSDKELRDKVRARRKRSVRKQDRIASEPEADTAKHTEQESPQGASLEKPPPSSSTE